MNWILDQLATNLRAQRVQRDLSQKDMATLLGLDHRSYGRIERGQQNITLVKLAAIAGHLGLGPADLIS